MMIAATDMTADHSALNAASQQPPPSAPETPATRLTTGALQSRNIRIHKHRTSVRLEPEMWNALNEIAVLENCTIHDLCGAVHDLKEPGASFTAALRVFMMEYYRSAARSNSQISLIQKRVKENKNSG